MAPPVADGPLVLFAVETPSGVHAVTYATLAAQVGDGQVSPAVRVWRKGLKDWVPFEMLASPETRIPCPCCDESIKPAAILCKHCRQRLDSEPRSTIAATSEQKSMGGVASIRPVPSTSSKGASAAAETTALVATYFSPRQLTSVLSSSRFWMLFSLAAVPLMMAQLSTRDFVGGIFFYFTLIWAVILFKLIEPERPIILRAVLTYLLSILVAMPLLVYWLRIEPRWVMRAIESGDGFAYIPACVVGIGLREEVTKLLPVLAVMIYLRRTRGIPLTLRQGLFLGVTSGLAFAGKENVSYFANYDATDRLLQEAYGLFSRSGLHVTLARLLMTPLVHAAWAGVVGYFAAWAEVDGERRWRILLAGIAAAAILHGLYDAAAFAGLGWISVGIIGFSLFVFLRCAAEASGSSDIARHLADRFA